MDQWTDGGSSGAHWLCSVGLLSAVQVFLQEFPAAAVCPAGCGVRSWRLRSSLGRLRPPCSYNRKKKKSMKTSIQSFKMWFKSFSALTMFLSHELEVFPQSLCPLNTSWCLAELDWKPSPSLSEHLSCTRSHPQYSLFRISEPQISQPAAFLSRLTATTGLIWHRRTAGALPLFCLSLMITWHSAWLHKLLSAKPFRGKSQRWTVCWTNSVSLTSCLDPAETTRSGAGDHSLGNLHDSADSSTVTLPHAPEARLATDVPQLQTESTVEVEIFTQEHSII